MKDTTPPAAAGDRPVPEDFTPAAELLVSDLETLRVLADPLRLRILEVFEAHPGMALTVKAVAGALAEPPTKLYYHVNLLEQHGLLVVVQRRLVSGIVEKQYRLPAESIRVERSLLNAGGEGLTDEARTLLDTVYGWSRKSLETSLRSGHARIGVGETAPEGVLLSRSTEVLTPEAAAEARRLMADLIARIHALSAGGDDVPVAVPDEPLGDGAATPRRYALLIAFHPILDEPDTATRAGNGDPDRDLHQGPDR